MITVSVQAARHQESGTDIGEGSAEAGISRPVIRQAVTIWYLQEWRRDAADVFQAELRPLKPSTYSPHLYPQLCESLGLPQI